MKIGTPYQGTAATKVCMYCSEVFTSKIDHLDDNYRTLSAQKQLEEHYLDKHRRVTDND